MTQLFSAAVIESAIRNRLPVFLDPYTLPTLTLVIAQEYTEECHAAILAKQILAQKTYPAENIYVTQFTSLDWRVDFHIDTLSMQYPLIIGDTMMPMRSFPMDADKHLRELRETLRRNNRKIIMFMGGFTNQNRNLIQQADSVLQLVVARDFIEEKSDKTLYGLCCRKWRGELDTPHYYSFLK